MDHFDLISGELHSEALPPAAIAAEVETPKRIAKDYHPSGYIWSRRSRPGRKPFRD